MTAWDARENTGSRAEPLPKRNPEHLTAQRLIELLSAYPPDLRVVVDGYESGYDDLSAAQLQRVRIALGVGEERWMGDHEELGPGSADVGEGADVVDALALRRRSR